MAASECVIPTEDQLNSADSMTAEGYFEHEAWIADERVQLVKDAVDEALNQRFPQADPKVDAVFATGFVGQVADHVHQRLVVVVDPALVDVTALQAQLTTTATAARVKYLAPELEVAVQPSCHSTHDLTKAHERLVAADWYPNALSTTSGWYLDAHDSTYHVFFQEKNRAAAEALKQRLGDVVTLEYQDGESTLDDRVDDGQPHWGGARIGPVGGSNTCTSGFTVDTGSAGKAMITAGHCFSLNQAVESGNEAYGSITRRRFPTYDMEIINASNQNYDDDLYHDPIWAENDPMDVEGGSTPTGGDMLCVSGGWTRAVCYVEVLDTCYDHTFLYNGEWLTTPCVMMVDKPGDQVCTGGDSGGPYYRRPGASGARVVHGIHHGRRDSSQTHECLAEKYSSIVAGLDVTAASSP